MEGLPLLRAHARRMFCAYSVERSIEAKHALVQTIIGRRTSGPALVSMSLRMTEIEAVLASGEDGMTRMCEILDHTRHAHKLPELLSIQEEPTLKALLCARGLNLRERVQTSKLLQVIENVVYLTMPSMQFGNLTQARQAFARAKAACKRAAARQLRQCSRPVLSFEIVSQHALVEHFRMMCKKAFSSSCSSPLLSATHAHCKAWGAANSPFCWVLEFQ